METSMIISIISPIISVIAAMLTWWKAKAAWKSATIGQEQLNTAVRSAVNAETATQLQRSNLLLQIEHRLADARRAVEDTLPKLQAAASASNHEELQSWKTLYESRQEEYLNRLERLATETNKGNFDIAEMQRQYRDTIKNVMKQYPEKFGTASDYREIKKLYERFEQNLDNLPSSVKKNS